MKSKIVSFLMLSLLFVMTGASSCPSKVDAPVVSGSAFASTSQKAPSSHPHQSSPPPTTPTPAVDAFSPFVSVAKHAKDSAGTFWEYPADYLVGAASAYGGALITQSVVAAVAYPVLSPVLVPLHAMNLASATESLVSQLTGHIPILVQLNPMAWASSWIDSQLNLEKFYSYFRPDYYKYAFVRGKNDSQWTLSIMSGLASVWQINRLLNQVVAGIFSDWKENPSSELALLGGPQDRKVELMAQIENANSAAEIRVLLMGEITATKSLHDIEIVLNLMKNHIENRSILMSGDMYEILKTFCSQILNLLKKENGRLCEEGKPSSDEYDGLFNILEEVQLRAFLRKPLLESDSVQVGESLELKSKIQAARSVYDMTEIYKMIQEEQNLTVSDLKEFLSKLLRIIHLLQKHSDLQQIKQTLNGMAADTAAKMGVLAAQSG